MTNSTPANDPISYIHNSTAQKIPKGAGSKIKMRTPLDKKQKKFKRKSLKKQL